MGEFPSKKHRFKKGQSGNPAGRPVGSYNIKVIARNMANDPKTWDILPIDPRKKKALLRKVGNKKTVIQAAIAAWFAHSLDDPRFANIILELLDGKSKQEVEDITKPSIADGGNLTIVIKK